MLKIKVSILSNVFGCIVFLLFSGESFSQVGIENTNPQATLDVIGQPLVANVPDGVIAPRISRADLMAKTAYSAAQTGAIVYVTDLSGTTNAATTNVTETGYYYFDGTKWNSMNGGHKFSYGDVKTGIQPADHNGWIKLDGRAISSLTASQQTRATSLGLSGNLPDATNAFLVQNGSLGTVSGSNSKTIAQSNLPNYNLPAATTSTNGSHTHSITSKFDGNNAGLNNVGMDNLVGDDAWNPGATYTDNTNANGNHSHSVTVNSGGGGVALDITPRSLGINTFIYLGE